MSGAKPDQLAEFVVYSDDPTAQRRLALAIARTFGEAEPGTALDLLEMVGVIDENREKVWL